MILLLTVPTSLVAAGKKRSHLLAALGHNSYTIIARSNADIKAPVGSLLKPFAAWYLLEKGHKPHDSVFCPPERKRDTNLRCWTPQGHGSVDLAAALVQSCNYYFLSLFAGRDLAEYQAWLTQRFDWPSNLPIRRPVHVYGFDLEDGIEAERLVKMYQSLLLSAERGSSHALEIRAALAGICRGTLGEFCRKMQKLPEFRLLIGKTGTVQSGKQLYGIALLVLEHVSSKEKILLLCYEQEKTGSAAAMAAPAILHRYADEIRKGKNIRR